MASWLPSILPIILGFLLLLSAAYWYFIYSPIPDEPELSASVQAGSMSD